jgi:glycosyltransferase involved in cell wall biosynthesis
LAIQTLPAADFEEMVVANACSDDTEAVAQSFSGRLNIKVVLEPRLGLHHARHAGARAATAPILAFTDDDVECSPEWLSALLHVFGDERVTCAGGPIKARFEESDPPLWFADFPAILGELDYGASDRALIEPEDLHGGNLAIRRERLFAIGGFEPDAFGDRWSGAGETGLIAKLHRAGDRILYCAAARVDHIIPAAHTTLDYAIARLRNHASTASILACKGQISTARLLNNAINQWFLGAIISCGSWFLPKSHSSGMAARIYAAYCFARARFDWRLAFDKSLQPLVTRTDWIHEA